MTCEEFRMAILGGDPAERAGVERHAAGCPPCDEVLSDHGELSDAVREWKASSPPPRQDLLARITAAATGTSAPEVLPFRRRLAAVRPPAWLAAAAALVLMAAALWVVQRPTPPVAGDDLERAMADAEKSRDEYARSIAELERSARTVLARAGDPEVTPEEAALLLSYRNRLAHLDAVIAEVRGCLDEHPGHAGGHTVLLAAYDEKHAVLGELLDLRLGETS